MFKATWKSYFKNNEKIPGNLLKIMKKIPGNLLKKPGNILEFCRSKKVGTLEV